MWPTPTPIPTGTPPEIPLPLDPAVVTENFSNWLLQGWNMFDSHPIATVIWFIVLAVLIYAGIMSIRRHVESL